MVSEEDGIRFFSMRWLGRVIAGMIALLLIGSAYAQVDGGEGLDAELDPEEVEQTIRQVAEWQLENPVDYPLDDWTMAPLYDGLIDLSLVTGDTQYLAAVIRAGRQVLFAPGENLGDADSHAAGHAWLRIHMMDPSQRPDVLDRFERHFDEILREKPIGWSWVDALYMAPPTMVLLGQATGNERYYFFAFGEFLATYLALYDPEEDLFYRDARYFDERTPNDEKVFWSRGNGWVYAGLALILQDLPEDSPSYTFYRQVFEDMSPAVLAAQQPDGLWHPSLHDPEHVDIGETSGSALFLIGMAWGVEQGILDRDTYWPAIVRGWNGLLTRIEDDGEVNYVQPIGREPEPFDLDNSEPYGTGAVLGAGAYILRAMGAAVTDIDQRAFRAEAGERADEAPNLSTQEPGG